MLKKARKLVNLWQKDYIKSNIYVIYLNNNSNKTSFFLKTLQN